MLADRHFVSQLREQAESAFTVLYEEYYGRIYRYLVHLVGNPHVAADLTQDTFVQIYTALPRLADDSNITAWVFQIATRVAYSYQRRRRLIRWLPLETWHVRSREPEDIIVQRDLVVQALAALSLEQRTCLLLQVWVGLSAAQISAMLGKSESAIKMTLMRARRQFRAAYGAESDEAMSEDQV